MPGHPRPVRRPVAAATRDRDFRRFDGIDARDPFA
jgi:hypothetical protein